MKFEQYWVPYSIGAGKLAYTERVRQSHDYGKYIGNKIQGCGNMLFELSREKFPSTGLIYEIK